MLALSFKQPWAWLVAAGIKDVDNRTWWLHMPPFLNYPADPRRIYVHASKIAADTKEFDTAFRMLEKHLKSRAEAWKKWHKFWEWYYRNPSGAIIGEVDIVACFGIDDIGYPAHKSPWFTGPYGLVLKNAVLYDKPFPFKGHQKFFRVEGLVKEFPR